MTPAPTGALHPPLARDRRPLGAALTLALVLAGGGWLARSGAPGRTAGEGGSLPQRFDAAVQLLQAGQHAQAVQAWHQVLVMAPRLVEAHVNMGYALLGLGRVAEARAFFDSATALQPEQANAYYGLALAWEAAGDLPMAMGAMRSYLHLARHERPEHLRRARAALWEWEQARAAAGAVAAASAPGRAAASAPTRLTAPTAPTLPTAFVRAGR